MLEWWWTWQFPIFPGQNHLHSKLMVVMLKERQRISDKGNVLWTKTKITIQETEPNSCQKWVTYLNLNTGIMPHLVNNTQTLYQSHHVSHLDPPKHTSTSTSHQPCLFCVRCQGWYIGVWWCNVPVTPRCVGGCCPVGVEAVFWDFGIDLCIWTHLETNMT